MMHTKCDGNCHADHMLHATVLSNCDGMCLSVFEDQLLTLIRSSRTIANIP